MSNVTPTLDNSRLDNAVFTWTPIGSSDTGLVANYTGSGDRTIQVFGTFGSGGTLILEGSNDGSNWAQLRDPTGTLISFTAAGIKAVLEHAVCIRPRATGGDGTTALTAILAVRRNYRD
jgi:hypothetical protein